MELFGATFGDLEVRKRASHALLRGSFPYGEAAVLSDGGATGRPRKEIIAPRAFEYRINKPDEEIHFLVGHDYGKPLASKLNKTLTFKDTDQALHMEVTISEELQSVSYVQDFLAAVSAGLILGLSPGFRIPPKRAVENAETITEEENRPEEGMHRAIIRTINAALLYEISAVTRPAYPQAQIEARSWNATPQNSKAQFAQVLNRWRL